MARFPLTTACLFIVIAGIAGIANWTGWHARRDAGRGRRPRDNGWVEAAADVVLRGGRVVDPESGLDAVRDVAIAGGRIARIGPGLPPGRLELDVAGQVVTSGFIDLHSHAHDLGSLRL